MNYQEKIEAAYKIASNAGQKEVCEALSDGDFLGKQEERWSDSTAQEIFEEILLSDLV